MKNIFKDDVSKYRYFMTNKDVEKYKKMKIIMALIPLLWVIYMAMNRDFSLIVLVPLAMFLFYKLPYCYLQLVHNQHCNDVVSAIPLWVNQLYALIEKNTIHNAIVNSLGFNTPKAIKADLTEFIDRIERNPNDQSAYMNFLSRYNIDGFTDIMLKLYEFKNLSKDKLKHEIKALNHNLGKIEQMKRQMRFKNETFMVDFYVCLFIFIPCMYLTVVSLMPQMM